MKTMQMIVLLLVMLLLPSCDREQQTKQVKEPSPEPGLEICDSSCEEMNKKNEEMIKKIEAKIRSFWFQTQSLRQRTENKLHFHFFCD